MAVDYPLPLALGAIAAIKGVKNKIRGTMPKRGGIISDMDKSGAEGMALALGAGVYRPRASGAIGYLADTAIGAGLAKLFSSIKNLVTGKKPENSQNE
jgi:hypothetical protein